VAQFRAAPAQIAADDGSLNGARESVENLLSPALIGVDELVRASDHPPHLVAAVLLELELAGRLQRHPGGQVSLAFE
jgi:DNA processing protein